ncbi:hypothetical protein Sjap_009264 [Stephania japonica]|uniref:Uncharacterized protein n=1 Tax=Stephania japonica TaxID=461633 RepID=A0AAP0PFD4_9MAGN
MPLSSMSTFDAGTSLDIKRVMAVPGGNDHWTRPSNCSIFEMSFNEHFTLSSNSSTALSLMYLNIAFGSWMRNSVTMATKSCSM